MDAHGQPRPRRDAADWRQLNRANWDERVPIHLASRFYDPARLRDGQGRLGAIEEAELGAVAGLRVLHLQCHFGMDTLKLAQRGAEVVGLDFSAPAIDAARLLARDLGLESRARFVEADVYDAPAAIGEPHAFDLVYVTWGAICWLPDMRRWAEVVAHFLKPDGRLYLADGHPAAYVFDDDAAHPDGMPGWFVPYFQDAPLVLDDTRDYADETARLRNARTVQWVHPLSETIGAVIAAGLRLDWLNEHDRVPWRMFRVLVRDEAGLYRWPQRPWLPLAFSLMATRPIPRG
jgi:SAM-dependent methyltransferase